MPANTPAEVFPPGEFIRDELEARGWSQVDLAEIIGRPPRLINEVVAGKRSVTPETARGLAAAFGTDAQFWMNLESAYQLSRVKPNDDAIQRRARLYKLLPMKEMLRRHWLEPTENLDVLEHQVMALLRVTSLDEDVALRAAARAAAQPSFAQCAWVERARTLARAVHCSEFRPHRVDDLLTKLRPLMGNAEDIRHTPRVMAEAGIRLVVVEHLSHTKIDGACIWLDAESPVVALSLRYDRIDAFWFTLLHELGHVKNRDGQGDAAVDEELVGETAKRSGARAPEELAADAFASAASIPTPDLDNFIARTRPLFSKAKIRGFAARLGVHPGLVVGQLQFRGEIPWTHSRDMLERIRTSLTGAALTDGWGNVIAGISGATDEQE